MRTKRKKLLLVDADQVFYKYTVAAQYEQVIEGDTGDEFKDAWMFEGEIALLSNIAEASAGIASYLTNLSEAYDRTILCFTSSPNYRHSVLSTYKGGRATKRKPLGYWGLVGQYIESSNWETRKYEGLEADDVMSIIATHPRYLGDYIVDIYSDDKDLKQVPNVWILNSGGDTNQPYKLREANHWRYTQSLTGDITDGYKGLKGWGPKKVEKYLDKYYGEPEDVYVDAVVSAYLDAGHTAEQAYQQIDCACILRYSEYDFKHNQPILVEDRMNG